MVLALNNPARLTAFHYYFTPLRTRLRKRSDRSSGRARQLQ
jgi:hypothetical protein